MRVKFLTDRERSSQIRKERRLNCVELDWNGKDQYKLMVLKMNIDRHKNRCRHMCALSPKRI